MTHSTRTETKLTGADYATRRAQVAAIKEAIVADGSPELHADSSALCTHFKLRRGFVPSDRGGLDACEAQLYHHPAGRVIRFFVYGADFSVKVRDLVLLPTFDKGLDTWLEADGRLFPHDGKYVIPAIQILNASQTGR